MSTALCLVFTTLPDAALAESVANELVASGLAACVKTWPACTSTYRWEGQIERTEEVPVIIVTHMARYAALEQSLKAAHPYDVPEILAIDCSAGLPDYLDWATRMTASS